MRSPAALLVASTFLTAPSAQLPDWASIPSPPGATIRLEQSWALVQDGTTFRAFSCVNRTWSTLLTLNPTELTVLNEAFLLRDGQVYHAFAPRLGRWVSQQVWDPNARIVPLVSPQSWLSVVVDGSSVHVFQAIDGTWTTVVCAGPPTVTMGTKCALVDDGQALHAVSAFYGTPVRLADASGLAVVIGVFGNSAVVFSNGRLHGFSAYRNQWATMPLTFAPTVRAGNAQAAFVAIEGEPNAVTFFSGHTGAFHRVATADPAPVASLERAVALVADGTTVHGYTALRGSSATLSTSVPPQTAIQQWFGLVEDGNAGVYAFSATTGTFSALLAGATLADIATRAETAIWQPQNLPGPNFAYLQHPNHWVMFPTQAIDQLAHTAGSIVVAEAGGGLWGLSLHGSSWVHQATPPIDDLWTGTSRPAMEMTVVARAGLDLWAFNARTSEWRHTQTSAPATLFQGNNTALIVSDGARAYGFSSWSDRWSSVALAGPVARSSAQVQAAFVDDGTSVHAYSGFGQVSTSHDYPEYWRAATLGARVHVHVAGEPGAVSVLAMSPVATHLPIPGLGTLRIDPATMGVLALPVLPSDGIFALRMQVPNVPALRGLGLHFQAMVAGPAAYLTNAVTVQLL